ncbi:MAG TPA: hypothetical protein VNO30_46130 [Kofleriaceae bacterium]|nr:hypothetical protein [Kofleriaceae bacterium]
MSVRLPADGPARLALLMGSNPLPNYLAAAILQPRAIVLVYTPETMEPRDRLREVLATRWPSLQIDSVCIDDATDPRMVRDACSQLEVDHLHYSGGTKPMAVHSRRALRVDDGHASYLDERRGLLRFDDGYQIDLSRCDLGLSLDVLLQLHGIERRVSKPSEGGPTPSDLDDISRWVRAQPERAQMLYDTLLPEGKLRSFTLAKTEPWSPAQHGLALSVDRIPGDGWNRARHERWSKFVAGGWLERWIADLVRSRLGEAPPNIEVSVNCKRTRPSPAEFEIDVALVRGHRLYVISCTTAQKKGLCKSKLFEVAMRARQMGGDLARSALVCLAEDSSTVRADIASIWDAPNVPRVFGVMDLREWAGDSSTPNTGSLEEWLDS